MALIKVEHFVSLYLTWFSFNNEYDQNALNPPLSPAARTKPQSPSPDISAGDRHDRNTDSATLPQRLPQHYQYLPTPSPAIPAPRRPRRHTPQPAPAPAPYQYPPTPSPTIPPSGSPRWHTPLQPFPEPTPMIEDMVYVAVGKEVKECRLILLWALQNSSGKQICILHVHQPAQLIPCKVRRRTLVFELGKEVGRGHFGHTCSTKGNKGELKSRLWHFLP
ncbi:CDPK-related kinase 6-like [Alnus glutinosa]|uniref:CDPK-related kinase 6-like n=1 Tax=Alnus glutinosa TaxID=3517 RepID=UPI002D786D0A|nr:CDPK-related kinase 6-like [Alnus glutinosa]